MDNIYLYICYLMEICRLWFRRICLTAGLVCACVTLMCGCAAKDSGLYRVSVGEDTDADMSDADAAGGKETASEADGKGDDPDPDGEADGGTVPTGTDTVEVPIPGYDLPAVVYVHVCGAVNDPGVYEMKQGDRIFNAVDAASGFTDEAATDYVNLAQEITDGMKITIPTEAEAEAMEEASAGPETGPIEYSGSSGSTGTATGSSAETAVSGTSDGRININTADVTALTSITGIGPTRAEAIIAYREQNGAFGSIEDIKNVSGIGDSTFNKMKDEITVQ